jgi:7,8-dihydro-6-hydroxymethylpterin dimethyltransferase
MQANRPARNKAVPAGAESQRSGCAVCGAGLSYFKTSRERSCYYCGRIMQADAECANRHFVCDRCHSGDALELIKTMCLHTRHTDATAIMQTLRHQGRLPMHGPEHHALVPAVLLAALRNSGMQISDEQIVTAIQRGASVAGGACAFLGACGAAIGAGIAVSIIVGATPVDADSRQAAQQATHAALGRIASLPAARCCQRDAWLAIQEALPHIARYTGITVQATPFACEQYPENRECIREMCPLWLGNPSLLPGK